MVQISEALKRQYSALQSQAKANIHRHHQASMAQELHLLSQTTEADEGRDAYGKGGIVSAFEHQLAAQLEKPDCVFLPTGTLAQCVAMKCYSLASNKNAVALHPTSHLLLHEHMAVEQLWGLSVVQVGSADKVLSDEDICSLDPQNLAAIIIESPMREIGGQLPNWKSLVAIRQWCDLHGVSLHLDGARIWQATQYYQRSLAQIAALFDSVYVSFYKDLNGIFGAALLANDQLVSQARVWARRAGGNPITLYPEVLAARHGLTTYLPNMPHYIDYTKKLCERLPELPINIIPETPQVAMFHLQFDISAQALVEKVVDYGQKTGVLVLPLPRSGDEHSCICEITIGDQASAHPPSFWADHLRACLA